MDIIKIGGSVITDKAHLATFKKETMDALSSLLGTSTERFILIHGAGSFGHITAKQHHLNEGHSEQTQIQGFSLTQTLVQTLNTHVLKSLTDNGIPAVALPPHALLTLDDHHISKIDAAFFSEYLDKGFIPVTYGDVALDHTLGFSICSGDLLVQELSRQFKPERVIFIIDEDGLYTKNPKLNTDAELLTNLTREDLSRITATLDSHADVTGGMKGKIDTIDALLPYTREVFLLNGNHPGRLLDILDKKITTCTCIKGEMDP